MSNKIKAIQLNEDGFVNIIRQFGGHGMRSDRMVLFADDVVNIREGLECMSSMAKDDYIAVKICKENIALIEKILEIYESKR